MVDPHGGWPTPCGTEPAASIGWRTAHSASRTRAPINADAHTGSLCFTGTRPRPTAAPESSAGKSLAGTGCPALRPRRTKSSGSCRMNEPARAITQACRCGSVDGSGSPLCRAFHGHPRRHDRECRYSGDDRRPFGKRQRNHLGEQQLPAGLCRAVGGIRAARSLVRTSAVGPCRPGHFHPRLGRVRAGGDADGAHRRPGGPTGAAAMAPQTMAFVTRLFPPSRRGVPMGISGTVAGIASITGPLFGGFLVQTLNWRWIFFVNVPVGVVAVVLTLALVPDRQPRQVTTLIRSASSCAAPVCSPWCSDSRRDNGTAGEPWPSRSPFRGSLPPAS